MEKISANYFQIQKYFNVFNEWKADFSESCGCYKRKYEVLKKHCIGEIHWRTHKIVLINENVIDSFVNEMLMMGTNG